MTSRPTNRRRINRIPDGEVHYWHVVTIRELRRDHVNRISRKSEVEWQTARHRARQAEHRAETRA